jgi:hypothetical protein
LILDDHSFHTVVKNVIENGYIGVATTDVNRASSSVTDAGVVVDGDIRRSEQSDASVQPVVRNQN